MPADAYPPRPDNGLVSAALLLGIIGCIVGLAQAWGVPLIRDVFTYGEQSVPTRPVALICGITALVLGIIAKRQIKLFMLDLVVRGQAPDRWGVIPGQGRVPIANAAIVLGIIAFGFGI